MHRLWRLFNFSGVVPVKIVNDLVSPEKNFLWGLSLRPSEFPFQICSQFLPQVPRSPMQLPRPVWRGGHGVARPVTMGLVTSKVTSLTCQGRQAVSPDLTHFPSSSCQALGGSSPSWLICFPRSDVSGEARMFSDVSGGDRFSDFNVSCHSFHSGRIIIKNNLPWKSLVIPSMCPKPDIWAAWLAQPLYNLRFPD